MDSSAFIVQIAALLLAGGYAAQRAGEAEGRRGHTHWLRTLGTQFGLVAEASEMCAAGAASGFSADVVRTIGRIAATWLARRDAQRSER